MLIKRMILIQDRLHACLHGHSDTQRYARSWLGNQTQAWSKAGERSGKSRILHIHILQPRDRSSFWVFHFAFAQRKPHAKTNRALTPCAGIQRIHIFHVDATSGLGDCIAVSGSGAFISTSGPSSMSMSCPSPMFKGFPAPVQYESVRGRPQHSLVSQGHHGVLFTQLQNLAKRGPRYFLSKKKAQVPMRMPWNPPTVTCAQRWSYTPTRAGRTGQVIKAAIIV